MSLRKGKLLSSTSDKPYAFIPLSEPFRRIYQSDWEVTADGVYMSDDSWQEYTKEGWRVIRKFEPPKFTTF